MNSLEKRSSTHSIDLGQISSSNVQILSGTIGCKQFRLDWMQAPSETDKGPDALCMKSYSELFKGKGEFVLYIEVLVANSECENWADDPYPKLGKPFPRYLPADYFFGKKEGDTVQIHCKEKNKIFCLTCQQNENKNAPEELFEEVMKEMFSITYKDLSNKYQKGVLTEKELKCWQIISDMKRLHYPNT
jgi:hypothetical protein